MRRLAGLSLATFALTVPLASVASCSCRTGTCPALQLEVVVHEGVDAEEFCGDPTECTIIHTDDWSSGIGQQSFTLPPPPAASWSMAQHRRRPTAAVEWWTVRAFDAQGGVLVEQVVAPSVDGPRGCRCGSDIVLDVSPMSIAQKGVEAPLPTVTLPRFVVVSTDDPGRP